MQVLVFQFQFLRKIVKKLLKTTQNKNKKHNEIVMLDRSKLNSIKSIMSERLIKMELVMKIL